MTRGRWGSNDTKRRTVLKGVGALGLASLMPEASARSGGVTRIGDFESSLDNWTTNGGNDLERVADDDVPVAVTNGEYALRVTSSGEPRPSIRRQITDVDLLEYPYFLADVGVDVVENSDNPVTFRMTYRYDRSGSSGRGNDGGPPVVQSPPIEVRQGYSGRIFWDMTSIGEDRRMSPTRLEVSWNLSETESRGNANGRGSGAPYRGDVYFDNIRVTDSRSLLSMSAIQHQIATLRSRHGTFEYKFESYEGVSERGRLQFYDGTDVPVEVEAVGKSRFEIEIGDEVHRLGGGWE